MKTVATLALLLLGLALPVQAQPADPQTPAEPPPPPQRPQPEPDRAELEKRFAETLSGATLDGFFTIEGRDKPPGREKYTLQKVTKLKGDYWLFSARIQFGGKDVTVPIMLPVKWAGDTPVITVTNVGIPGLGTYTARVIIYDDHYAGTWSGADHGGHLWGRVVRADAAGEAPQEKTDGEKEGAGESAEPAPPQTDEQP